MRCTACVSQERNDSVVRGEIVLLHFCCITSAALKHCRTLSKLTITLLLKSNFQITRSFFIPFYAYETAGQTTITRNYYTFGYITAMCSVMYRQAVIRMLTPAIKKLFIQSVPRNFTLVSFLSFHHGSFLLLIYTRALCLWRLHS